MNDILEILGIEAEDAWDEDNDAPHIIALKKMELICQAYNEGWEPNWNNSKEAKWYACWYLNDPGFRLDGVDNGYALSLVGSRLVFKSEELARFAAETFKEIYKDFIA